MTVSSGQRFSRQRPCPVCGGYDQAPRGKGKRCHGFLSEDGEWAHCVRPEYASQLEMKPNSETYAHRLVGDCRCGARHDDQPAIPQPNPNSSTPQRVVVAEYDYNDEDGNLLFQTVRYEPKDFNQRQPDGKGGWMWNLQGVRRVLYQLPELIAADPKLPRFVTEGEKDANRLRASGLVATCNPMGAKKWLPEYSGSLEDRHVVIIQDNDNDGQDHVEQVAQALHGIAKSVRVLVLSGLPDHGDVSDWLDAGHTGDDLVKMARTTPRWVAPPNEAVSVSVESETEWRSMQKLPAGRPSAPSLQPGMVPEPMRNWVLDLASRVCMPLESLVCPALVGIGSVVGRSVGIRPGRYDDYVVVPNFWGGTIARPGAMKSHAIEEATKPVARLEILARNRYQAEEDINAAAKERFAAEIGAIKSDMTKTAKDARDASATSATPPVGHSARTMDALERDLAEKIEGSRQASVTQRRYMTQDATVEKLGELLNENPNGLLVLRDELSGFLRTLDKSGREGDREFYLESWGGTGWYTFDRIGRGTIVVDSMTISICGGIQPNKLSDYIQQAIDGTTGDDGLVQRFQLMVWPDSLPPWVKPEGWPDSEVRNRAFEIFKFLDGVIPEAVGAEVPTVSPAIPFLRFSQGAQEIYDAWREDLERRLRSEELAATPAFESHLSKYRSLMPSLALLFHLIEIAAAGPPGPVSAEPTLLAAAWCVFLAFVHGVPSAILLGECPPLGAGTGNPQDTRKETPAVLLLPDIHTRTDG